MEKYVNPQLQASRDMIDAIRAMMGLDPLYGADKETPCYASSYMIGIGDGNRQVNGNIHSAGSASTR